MNKTGLTEIFHIAIVGKRNVGKSSLVNNLTGQELSVVSETAGTTTAPEKNVIELLPYGPVVLVDTAGIDDEGEPGQKRISKTINALSTADFAIVVLDGRMLLSSEEKELFNYLDKISINYLIAVNKIDFGVNPDLLKELKNYQALHYEVSCKEKIGIESLKRKIIRSFPSEDNKPLIGDIVGQGDVIILVVPSDLCAPKGKLILQQVQTIREALDEDTITIVVKDKEFRSALSQLKVMPDLVIADSQSVLRVQEDLPEEVPMTTFSILMARYKGELPVFVDGLKRVEKLGDKNKILISEACSHHPQENNNGTVKIPEWLRLHTKKDLDIEFNYGPDFPDDLSSYDLIVHCGGCMLTCKEMQSRINKAKLLDVPIVNYGVLISYMYGAIPRALKPFGEAMAVWGNTQL